MRSVSVSLGSPLVGCELLEQVLELAVVDGGLVFEPFYGGFSRGLCAGVEIGELVHFCVVVVAGDWVDLVPCLWLSVLLRAAGTGVLGLDWG